MVLTEENKQYILNEHLRNISRIAGKEYQKKVWIRGEGSEVNDFDETVCYFFDAGDPLLEEYEEYSVTEKQYQILKKFRDEFEAFSDNNTWPPEFIDTPEWAKIMDQAKEVLRAFEYKKDSDSSLKTDDVAPLTSLQEKYELNLTEEDKDCIFNEFLKHTSCVADKENSSSPLIKGSTRLLPKIRRPFRRILRLLFWILWFICYEAFVSGVR